MGDKLQTNIAVTSTVSYQWINRVNIP